MTMELIATQTVGAGGGNITFSSIPQTFTDIFIEMSVRSGAAQNFDFGMLTINGYGNGHYTRELRVENTTRNAGSWGNTSWFIIGMFPGASQPANWFGTTTVMFPNYSITGNKTMNAESGSRANATGSSVTMISGGYQNQTAAITSLTIFAASASLAQNSTVSLYGITKGSGGGTPATT